MRRVIIALSLTVLACHGTGSSSTAGDDGVPVDPEQGSATSSPPAQPRDRSVMIERGEPHLFHEVELDPRAEAALTLDFQGQLLLWPAIRSGDRAQSRPFVLPMKEPLWMSIAQADGGYLVATVDTNNAGQVVAVSPDADGLAARLTPLFSIPPSDPLLEIHALDGGRVLALGVDHRVRLYDRSGALLSVIDQRSFAPWQLRVVHAEPGQPPRIAAVLAQPLRVQTIELRDDTLKIASEARTVVLDRGPNHNDLTLSPDGKTIAALRRRSGRGRDFSIELIDLETGARRLVAGQSDTTIRPRMHFVDAERILLETGSSKGTGLWVELAKAEPLADPADADPDSKLARRLAKSKHDSIPLAASAEHKPEFFDAEFDPPWDEGERLHASVVAGIRVNIERDRQTRLIVDPLDSDRHLAIVGDKRAVDRVALDRTGDTLAWTAGEKLWVAAVGGASGVATELDHGLKDVALLSFVDDQRVVVVESKGQLRLIDWQAGQVVASSKLDNTWGIAAIALHDSPAGGVLGYRSGKPSDPIRLLPIENGQLGSRSSLARDQRPQWLEILNLGDAEAGALFGMSEAAADDELDEYTSDRTGRLYFTKKHPRTPLIVREGADQRSIALPAGQGRELSASPDGSKIAIVQFRERDDDSVIEDHLLTVIDVASGERLWTIGSPGGIPAPTWSGDGKRIVVKSVVRDAATGDVLDAGLATPTLIIEDRSDADWARQAGFSR